MDMLIRLYALPGTGPSAPGCLLRKPLSPEHALIADWIARHFSPAWSSEAQAALANRPVSLFIATRHDPAELIGFCCYDATARGLVGPIGVLESARRSGIGAALLRACLDDMRAAGYAYAVAGAVGAPDFFRRVAGATDIERSEPGLYRGMLRADTRRADPLPE
jgi:ribosomal protein S18 acetylase RimI-like enzyme